MMRETSDALMRLHRSAGIFTVEDPVSFEEAPDARGAAVVAVDLPFEVPPHAAKATDAVAKQTTMTNERGFITRSVHG